MSLDADILRKVPLFAGLPADALAALAAQLRRRTLPGGTPVVYKGDPSGSLYLIESGRVKVHQATARGLLLDQPAAAWTLLQILSLRVRDANTQAEMMMTRDVPGRVAACLLRLAETQGTPLPGGHVRVNVGLTQSDIAALIGATRERVSRALTAFRASGAIQWDKDAARWLICKPTLLAKRAEM